MLLLPETVVIEDRRTGRQCKAEIVRLTKELAKQIDAQWWQIGGSKTARQQEGDHGWKWADICGQSRMDQWSECLGMVTEDGIVQGAINYHLNGKSLITQDLGAIFIHHFATAPRNRPWLVASPHFRGVGQVLLVGVIRHSYSLGFGGRVTLVSLSSEKTRQFYQDFGFARVDEDEDGNIEYELTPEVAQQRLRERGYLS